MYTFTAADFADTGQWRLLLNIGVTGLEAFLENTIHPDSEPQLLCKAEWNLNRDKLKDNIEEAVYNNPRLLDDFATRIILFDPRTLFIPTRIAEEAPGQEEKLYTKIYPAEDCDIMTDFDRDVTAAWSLAPGVKSFLMRTFPGARISCNLLEKVRNLRKGNSGNSFYLTARTGECDIIFLEDSNLISASTHEWQHADDLAFLALNLIKVYEFKLENISVFTQGFSPDTEAWSYILKNAYNKR